MLSFPPNKGHILLVGSDHCNVPYAYETCRSCFSYKLSYLHSSMQASMCGFHACPRQCQRRTITSDGRDTQDCSTQSHRNITFDPFHQKYLFISLINQLNQGDLVVHSRAEKRCSFPSIPDRTSCGSRSALAAPIFTGVPVTKRIVVESVVVCIGVGRQGKQAELPSYERTRMVLLLIGVARIE